jgi:hypothetical protein
MVPLEFLTSGLCGNDISDRFWSLHSPVSHFKTLHMAGGRVLIKKELRRFLTNEMCIDVDNLLKKMQESECNDHLDDFYRILDEFFTALQKENAEEAIQRIFLSYEHIFDHQAAYAVIDSLRHAFDGFAYGGLHQLYTRQENEAWYPRIRLSKELAPNDIAILVDPITIYRGCSNANEHV